MTPRDLLALLALAAVWGGSFLFIRVSVASLGPLPLAAGRVAIAAIVLAIGMPLLGRRVSLRGHVRPLLVLGALNAALPYALISASELHLTASYAAMLNATVPLWSVAFGAVWLGERVTGKRIAGLGVGLLGVAVLVGWSPVEMTPVVVLCIAASLVATASYALAGIYAKKRLSGVSSPALALGQQVGALPWLVLPRRVAAAAHAPHAGRRHRAARARRALDGVRLPALLPSPRVGGPDAHVDGDVPPAGVRVGVGRAVPRRVGDGGDVRRPRADPRQRGARERRARGGPRAAPSPRRGGGVLNGGSRRSALGSRPLRLSS